MGIDPLLAKAVALAETDPVGNAAAISALTELAKELRQHRLEAGRLVASQAATVLERAPIPLRRVPAPKKPKPGRNW